jgi:regulator of vacuolar morphogenesis
MPVARSVKEGRDLIGTPNWRPSSWVFGAPPETERTKGLDNQGVLQLQTQIMQEQDDQMDEFLKQVRRTRGIAELEIHEELGQQVELLGGLEEDVDRVGDKQKRATKQADKLK